MKIELEEVGDGVLTITNDKLEGEGCVSVLFSNKEILIDIDELVSAANAF